MDNEWKNEKGKWDLEKIAIECISQLRKLGIPIGCITYIKVCRDRFVTGKLAKVQECLFGLYIPNIYRSPRYGLEEIKTVIFHQLLHSAGGCMDHGEKWGEICRKSRPRIRLPHPRSGTFKFKTHGKLGNRQ